MDVSKLLEIQSNYYSIIEDIYGDCIEKFEKSDNGSLRHDVGVSESLPLFLRMTGAPSNTNFA